MEVLVAAFIALSFIYAVRTVTNMPERWPEILTAIVLVGSIIWSAIRSVNRMSESIGKLEHTISEFKTEFKEARADIEQKYRMTDLQVEGLSNRLAVQEAQMKAMEKLVDRVALNSSAALIRNPELLRTIMGDDSNGGE